MAVGHRHCVHGVLIELIEGNRSVIVEDIQHGSNALLHELLAFWTARLPRDPHRTFDRGRIDELELLPDVVLHQGLTDRRNNLHQSTVGRRHTTTHEG